ncbi:MAG: DUF4349 domain-containing protein [Cyclobacteriaceae bacterium]
MKTNLVFFVAFVFAACSGSNENVSSIEPYLDSSNEMYSDISPGDLSPEMEELGIVENADFRRDQSNHQSPQPQKIDRKIIRNASIYFQVSNFDSSTLAMEAAIKKYDAYLTNSQRTGGDHRKEGNMAIRVRSDQLNALINDLVDQSIFLHRQDISSNDVTEEFIDLEIRLRNKKEVEKKYLEILDKAKTIKEILSVEEQVRVIREEIEAKEGRLRFLQSQVAYSTINLDYYQEEWLTAEAPGISFLQRMADGFSSGWDLLLGFVVGLSYAWPFLLILTGIFFWVRWYLKKRRVA